MDSLYTPVRSLVDFQSRVRQSIVFVEVPNLFSRRVKKGEQFTKELAKLETADLSYPWEKMDFHH